MNVALISNEYPPFNNVGGIATFMAGLAKLLASLGHKVTVFADLGASMKHETTYEGITVIPFINLNDISLFKIFIQSIPGRLATRLARRYAPTTTQLFWINLRAFLTFRAYRTHRAIDVIHTPVLFAPAYLISVMFPAITIVTHAQGPDELLQPYDWISWDTRLKARIEASFMLRARFIIPCSQTINDYLKKKYHTVRKKLVPIPNFVDTKTFPPSKKSLDTNTLLFIGRMEYRKGPDLVVQAFAKLIGRYPKLKLILLGEDTSSWFVNGRPISFSHYLKSLRLPTSIRRHITFIPRIDDRTQLLIHLRAYRGIAILPSRYEPFGFVFIETMMMGYVTVASTRGGGAEIIQNGVDGFVVEPTEENIIACVQEIKDLSAQQRMHIARRAKEKIISTYDMSNVTDAYITLYHQIENNQRL